MIGKKIADTELVKIHFLRCQSLSPSLTSFAPLSPIWQRYHFGTIFRTLWGSKHSFHGNITEAHIDKRIGAAVFFWWRMKPQKLKGASAGEKQLNAANMFGKIGIHISRGICLISHYEADNKRLLSGLAKSSLWRCLPPSLPPSLPGLLLPWLRAVANGQQFPTRFYFTNGYIDLVQLLIKLGGTIRHRLIWH